MIDIYFIEFYIQRKKLRKIIKKRDKFSLFLFKKFVDIK